MRIVTQEIDKWKQRSLSEKLYTLAKWTLLLPTAALVLTGRITPILTWAMALPMLLFMAGFFVWITPILRELGKPKIRTIPLVVLSALFAPLCLGLARQYVAVALQLPPQSFDVTVALVTSLFIPVIWAGLATLILMAGFAVSNLIPVTSEVIRPFLTIFAVTPEGRPARTLQRLDAIKGSILDHAFGALAVAVAVAMLVAAYAHVVLNPTFIRLAAYGLDFSYASRYPGIQPNRRMRLLDNGFVAYADRQGLDVQIDVVELALPDKGK
ncbi:hypothetical protein WJ58_02920 [Burkholderia ubonensis]|nr:hypothetical protein WJ58_02920 [Burkholderia ubonensis]